VRRRTRRHAGGNVGSVDEVRLTAYVEGRVQGVGFRYWTRVQARALGLSVSATNLPDGNVEVVAEGRRSACEALLDWLRGTDAPGYVRSVTPEWGPPDGAAGFTVR
jgi:acylphosphatase